MTDRDETYRNCFTAEGNPKIAFASFDDAFEAAQAILSRRRGRVHAYRCTAHGWHIGGNVARVYRDEIDSAQPHLPRRYYDEGKPAA